VLTAALKPLKQRGLVRVTPDPADRRRRPMTLTPRGVGLLARAVPVWERTHTAVEGLIHDGDPDSLRNDLRARSRSAFAPSPIIPRH
jgi:DNA-binding MarR family transcriptional regulator